MLRIKQDSCDFIQQIGIQYVPLKKVAVEAYINLFAVDVTIKQIFRNNETKPIEAVYCFPIEEQAAVYSFIAQIDERQIVAYLKEKQEAQREYNNALRQGHGAYLLEQDEKSQDNFIINVGALPPGKECHISISYVSELNLVQNGSFIRFCISTTIAPRYNPDEGGISSPAGTTAKYVQKVPYTIEIHCYVTKLNVSRVSSSSHPILIETRQDDFYFIQFAQENTYLDRDIIVDIELENNRSNTIVAVEPGAIMASFTPTEQDCQRTINNAELANEFIFVVDCSGSMENKNKIGLVREAMLLFLKSLPTNCHFNIIRFGSNYCTLFDDITAIYNEENAQKAEQLTKYLKANLGGTELLEPLQWLEKQSPRENRARQIFLLTDGEISNVDQVLDICRSMATSTRIFSFGLGHSPSRSLVKGLARATNGSFVFIPSDTSVDIHVGEQLRKALQPCITNIQVKWNVDIDIMHAPTKLPPIYANDRLMVYGLANDPELVFDHNSSVVLKIDENRLGEAKINSIPQVSNNNMIARLAAKALILELQHSKLTSSTIKNITLSLQSRFKNEQLSLTSAMTVDEKEITKQRIIELSLKYQILSPHTTFVGIEQRINGNNVGMFLREVPIQISTDDQHLFRVFPMSSIPKVNCHMAAPLVAPSSTYRHACGSTSFVTPFDRSSGGNMFDPCVNDIASCCVFPDVSEDFLELDDILSYEQKCDVTEIHPPDEEEPWPTEDQHIVRYLINKQKFDGLWDLNENDIEKLTGKSFANFSQIDNPKVAMLAIVIITLETRYSALSLMWHGVIQKALKRLLELLGHNADQLRSILEMVRQQL
ncbi:unnamed protein product [Rotaria sp. Silwood2]|nr:unnamed protein product [Rotaria sp. Silwood2]CAF3303733.1 unnamed protein product [Rotaria sp. Silwood2]CAF4032841.1 unnamed protein product [Rotaria sp. Silwood2]